MSGSGRAVWINNSVKKKKAHIIKKDIETGYLLFLVKDGENRRERMKDKCLLQNYTKILPLWILFYVDFCGKIV